MKRIVTGCVMAVTCFGLTGVVQSVRPVVPPPPLRVSAEPFVGISVKPDKLYLGTVSPLSCDNLPAKLEAHIVANCPHQVKASFTAFKRGRSGVSIDPKHASIVINGVNVPVAGSAVAVIKSDSPTPPEGVDVPLDIKFAVGGALHYPAGPYKGNLVLTITTKP